MKKYTVTVGIPAYNEEANIENLLNDILKQREKTIKIKKIIVVSDKSTDKTDELVVSYKNKKITLITNKKRIGKPSSQNIITKISESDFLVILDADVKIKDKNFLESLILPMFNNKNVWLVSPKILPLKSVSIFGDIIDYSVELKNSLYHSYKQGHNIYSCHGRARAFSKALYKKIIWPDVPSEDAYSFLYVKLMGKRFYFCENTEIYYRSPQNFKDHLSQSKRFLGSKTSLGNHFSTDFINSEYQLTSKKSVSLVLKKLIKNPLYFGLYLGILIKVKMSNNKFGHIWDEVRTSKSLETK